jgi:hypothetical protein
MPATAGTPANAGSISQWELQEQMECQQQEDPSNSRNDINSINAKQQQLFVQYRAHSKVRITCLGNKPVTIAQAATVLELS